MSVIVRGMNMPKNCSDCPLNYDQMSCSVTGTGWWSDTMVLMDFDSCKERLHNCPLIDIPTPHGRLGDLNALWDRMSKYSDNEGAKMPYGDNDFMIHRDSACELIEDAPTVIEAEAEEKICNY